jgi:hypothetical protein
VGVSAYLAELYMKDIDKEIQALPNLVYYARYVDDIIVIFTPENIRDTTDYITLIRQIMGSAKNQLLLNPKKTSLYSTITPIADFDFTFLGYKISLIKSLTKKETYEPIKIGLSDRKVNKYKSRIVKSLNSYVADSKYNQRAARKMLLKRINFLTTNTKLINSKSNIIVGVHYSNILVTHIDDFEHLDRCLSHHVFRIIKEHKLQQRLVAFTFTKGFTNKRFTAFNPKEFIEILKIWRDNS